ncbi:uncharacterized protein LOC125507006 [Triticum urartu]|uniref:uncharacterized protein LOC125507006 n=1 Tax=Triticum urartu TaxID=4572 RepID=UPI00204380A4|nr:uncharacterized protein LOC125507006 [Triticum urartu]
MVACPLVLRKKTCRLFFSPEQPRRQSSRTLPPPRLLRVRCAAGASVACRDIGTSPACGTKPPQLDPRPAIARSPAILPHLELVAGRRRCQILAWSPAGRSSTLCLATSRLSPSRAAGTTESCMCRLLCGACGATGSRNGCRPGAPPASSGTHAWLVVETSEELQQRNKAAEPNLVNQAAKFEIFC